MPFGWFYLLYLVMRSVMVGKGFVGVDFSYSGA